MELYRLSSADPSLGVAKRLLQNWRSHYPEYPTTANALMKRVRTLKKQETAQVPMAGSVAATEGEESSLPTISVPGDMERDGPNITSSDVSDTGMPREDPGPAEGRPVDTQGEPEEDVLDSDPELRELVEKVDRIYRQLLRQGGNLRGRRSTKWRGVRVDADRHAAIDQWMKGVKSKTLLEVNCIGLCGGCVLAAPKTSRVET
jgi:hypothetical protein